MFSVPLRRSPSFDAAYQTCNNQARQQEQANHQHDEHHQTCLCTHKHTLIVTILLYAKG